MATNLQRQPTFGLNEWVAQSQSSGGKYRLARLANQPAARKRS
jgi:hypothetical protein